jgi:hypothetical protein
MLELSGFEAEGSERRLGSCLEVMINKASMKDELDL